MKEVTYEKLKSELEKVGLVITDQKWSNTDNNSFVFEAKISSKSFNNRPNIIDGAVHKGVSASGESPDKVIENLWKIIRSSKLFLGSYNNYLEVVEWSMSSNELTKRLLSQKELLEVNYSI